LQSTNIAKITSIKTNFAKDSAERKTQAYLEKKATLEEAWSKVVDYNDALKQVPNRLDRYFTQEVFQQTKTQYAELKATINGMKETMSTSTSTTASTSSSALASTSSSASASAST
jgi:predicted ATP-binding protein involved in virulence